MSLTSNQVDALLSDESAALHPDITDAMLENTRNVRCEVLRHFTTKVPGGGSSASYKVVGVYEARLGVHNSTRPVERLSNDELLSQSGYVVGLPISADIVPRDRIAIPGLINKWERGKAYAAGDLVVAATNKSGLRRYYRSVVAGVSGANEPQWSADTSMVILDGTVAWREEGKAIMLEVIGLQDMITNGHETLVHVTEVL